MASSELSFRVASAHPLPNERGIGHENSELWREVILFARFGNSAVRRGVIGLIRSVDGGTLAQRLNGHLRTRVILEHVRDFMPAD
jgi:hypothetical protein